jgi:hypothetical protein
VSKEILASMKTDNTSTGDFSTRYIASGAKESKTINGVIAFKKKLKTIIQRELALKHHPLSRQVGAGPSNMHDSKDISTDLQGKDSNVDDEAGSEKAVLTLYANASGPRMLFSSLQRPTRIKPSDEVWDNKTDIDTSIEINPPVQEAILPNVMFATKIVSTRHGENEKDKSKLSFGDLFAQSANSSQLSPPKKSSTTRGNVVSWIPQEVAPKPSRNGYVYATQNLTSGQWLGYGGLDSQKEPISYEAKQKHRQRALSTGEAKPPVTQATIAALQQAKEEALYRSVYGSFAPSHDDAIAIIPAATKSRLWWHKHGKVRYLETFPIDPALLDTDEEADMSAHEGMLEEPEEDSFQKAVNDFDEADIVSLPTQQSEVEKEVADVLKEISELLETLHSYQRIRNSSLSSNSRTPVTQNASLALLSGSPSTPSAAEIDIYQILKSQLSLMISQLPPYAVAKLNGDQLSELNISRNILIETKDYRGVMEEDSLTRSVKASQYPSAMGTASAIKTPGQHNTYNPSSSYSRPTPSSHASSTRATSSYYSHQHPSHRSSSISYSKPSASTASYNAPSVYQANSGYSSQRSGYPSNTHYSQQTSRPTYTPGSSSYLSNQSRQPTQAYGMPSTYYPNTPQAQNATRSYQTSNTSYQSGYNTGTLNSARPNPSVGGYYLSQQTAQTANAAHPTPYGGQRNGMSSTYSQFSGSTSAAQSPHVRTASPIKPATPIQAHAQPPRQQGQFSTPAFNTATQQSGVASAFGASSLPNGITYGEQQKTVDRLKLPTTSVENGGNIAALQNLESSVSSQKESAQQPHTNGMQVGK